MTWPAERGMRYTVPNDAICLICGVQGDVHVHTVTRTEETGMQQPILVGTVLYGAGCFGRGNWGAMRVEAVGADWLVARDENGRPHFGEFSENPPGFLQKYLAEYTVKPSDWDERH